jgi:hypothetical protein
MDTGMPSGAGGKEAIAACMARLLMLYRAHARLVLLIKFGTKSSAYSAGKQRGAINFHQGRIQEKLPTCYTLHAYTVLSSFSLAWSKMAAYSVLLTPWPRAHAGEKTKE